MGIDLPYVPREMTRDSPAYCTSHQPITHYKYVASELFLELATSIVVVNSTLQLLASWYILVVHGVLPVWLILSVLYKHASTSGITTFNLLFTLLDSSNCLYRTWFDKEYSEYSTR
jgi:hypothetical protein